MTTAISLGEDTASPVKKAIRAAAKATGIGFDYLVTTATRESALDPAAKASTSSASGLFQFTDGTWLNVMKEHGASFGLAAEADAIGGASGNYSIDDPAMRRHIMGLRMDAETNAMMAGAFTADNSGYLSNVLSRDPTHGELYIAHFLGARGAGDFITQAGKTPDAAAADYFPKAANANRSIFYKNGQKRSLSDVYAALVSHHQNAPLEAQRIASAQAVLQPAAPGPVAQAQGAPDLTLFRNMFTPRRAGGVSPVVAALWTKPADSTPRVAPEPANIVAKPFFPMSRTIADGDSTGS